MITGPLGIRYNEWFWVGKRLVLRSPQNTDFEWREPVVWAKSSVCRKDKEGHLILDWQSEGGIYTTVSPGVTNWYNSGVNAVLTLCECLDSNLPKGGNIFMLDGWEDGVWCGGWISPGAEIVYVVDRSVGSRRSTYRNIEENNGHNVNTHALALTALAQQFHLQVISLDDALALCRIQWEKFGGKWKGH